MVNAVSTPKRVMLVVGEASGDIHGAQLAEALLQRSPGLSLFGVAGEHLRRLRFEALIDVSRLAGMGLVELAGHLKDIWAAYQLLRRALRERRPNLLVLIDFPEFNLRLAKYAKGLGIPVLYYVSPQIWAWRRGRVRQIARWVDRMAVVFPFEVAFYQSHGVNVTYVGHPLLDSVRPCEPRAAVLARLGFDPEKPVIALLPGSRRREVAYHLPVMLQAAALLRREREVQFLCVRASTVDRSAFDSGSRSAGVDVRLVEQGRYDAVNAADLVWTASGTATLETALLLKPMIIVYRLAWLTFWIARWLVRVEHIGMANLIAGERVVPELVQGEFTPQRMVAESRRILDSPEARSLIIEKLSKVKDQLGSSGAAGRVAELAVGMMA
jgi:lipid-A-disaccharide synthase